MEIKVYQNLQAYMKRKPILCSRVSDPDNFDFQATKRVLKCLYGDSVYLEILCA